MPGRKIQSVVGATASYEAWAGQHFALVRSDLNVKHRAMTEGAFTFMRGTFYRWVQLFNIACPDLAKAPRLLAVGDLHIENFGSWRDREGRLIWGINDVDEAHPMPYTIDLVRLAASALFASAENSLVIGGDEACSALLAGYWESMRTGAGKPFVLEESHPHLRAMALGAEREPMKFWEKLIKLKPVSAPDGVEKLLRRQFPEPFENFRIVRRSAGVGSRGRPRYLALAEFDGGMMAREAKAVLPSAYVWAMGGKQETIYGDAILKRAIRAPDRSVKIRKGWQLRRLAPHCTRIELKDFPTERDELLILKAMGHETANIHLGSASVIDAVCDDLRHRGGDWLFTAAKKMVTETAKDWAAWRKAFKG
jgi:hypothetical protein